MFSFNNFSKSDFGFTLLKQQFSFSLKDADNIVAYSKYCVRPRKVLTSLLLKKIEEEWDIKKMSLENENSSNVLSES